MLMEINGSQEIFKQIEKILKKAIWKLQKLISYA